MMFTEHTKYYIIFIQYAEYQNLHPKYGTPNPNTALVSLSWPVGFRQLPHKMTCHKPDHHHDYNDDWCQNYDDCTNVTTTKTQWFFSVIIFLVCLSCWFSPLCCCHWLSDSMRRSSFYLFVWNPILKFNIFRHLLKISAFQDRRWMTNRMMIS